MAGVFLCFSNTSYAQYHHTGSSGSSGSSGGDGDGAWGDAHFAANVGVGFLGSGVGDITSSGAASSTSPAYELSFERALSSHFGLGFFISYQTATSSTSSTVETYTINPVTYLPTAVTYTTTDNYKVSLINIDARFAYHLSAGDKLDPYVGVALGYCSASATDNQTTNDPNNVNTGGGSNSITGIEYGGYAGARYFFTDHIGAWLELQYTHATFTYQGYSSSINTANILNLGITFKW